MFHQIKFLTFSALDTKFRSSCLLISDFLNVPKRPKPYSINSLRPLTFRSLLTPQSRLVTLHCMERVGEGGINTLLRHYVTRVGRQACVSRTISREHDDDDDGGSRDEGDCAFIGHGVEEI